jgi:hypothetical protein
MALNRHKEMIVEETKRIIRLSYGKTPRSRSANAAHTFSDFFYIVPSQVLTLPDFFSTSSNQRVVTTFVSV